MSLHFVSHPWQVQDFEDGILVTITPQDLNLETIALLVDDLFDLALESGRSQLYLDFGAAGALPSLVVGKLFALDRKLRTIDGSLYLCNLDPDLSTSLQVVRFGDQFDQSTAEVASVAVTTVANQQRR
jgi:anti-anti-sigma regulatory factor